MAGGWGLGGRGSCKTGVSAERAPQGTSAVLWFVFYSSIKARMAPESSVLKELCLFFHLFLAIPSPFKRQVLCNQTNKQGEKVLSVSSVGVAKGRGVVLL